MNLIRRTWPIWLAGSSGAAILAVMLSTAPRQPDLAAADNSSAELVKDVLDRVPSDAGFFAHGRASDLWNVPLVKDIRKAAGAEGEKALKEFEKQMGLLAETVETVTFYFPQMPQGPGDEKTFVVAVITNKPYDRTKIMDYLRAKPPVKKLDAKPKVSEIADLPKDSKEKEITFKDTVKLQEDFVLHFTNERTFAVMHKSLVAKYVKGAIKDRKDGPISKALKLATEKHTAVAAFNLGALSNEIVTNLENLARTRPFAPLFKSNSATLIADLDKNLTLEVRFACENANAAIDAERSMNLLMKLAEEGLNGVLKDKNTLKEIGPLLPVLKEVEKSVKGIQISKNDNEMKAVFTLKADMPVADTIKTMIDKAKGDAAQAQGRNNLKQIALAMHNYHDANNGFPPGAICDKKGKPLLSWRVALLPYIEQQNVYNQFKLDEPWDSENNIKLAKIPIKVYMVPGVSKPGETNYRIFTGNGAAFDMVQQSKIQEIADGTSNTLMVFESAEGVPWSKPDEVAFDPEKEVKKLFLWQNDKTNIAMCDGSVRSIGKKMSEKTWKNLIQKADGNVLGEDFE